MTLPPATHAQAATPSGQGQPLHVPPLDPDVDTLTAGLTYAAAGWYVLPVKRGLKHPGSVLGDKWQHKSSRDPETIVAWFAGTDHGIALHCGRSGAVVFDVDFFDRIPAVLAAAFTEQPAPIQSTRPNQPGRGHWLYAVPPGRVFGNGVGRLGGEWGEIRGRNGVIIVAPSVHEDAADGACYQWQRTGPVPELPEPVAALLGDATSTEDAATDTEITEFLDSCTDDTHPEILDRWVNLFTTRTAAGESRHQRMISVATGAMKEARAGYFPARKAAEQLGRVFLDAVAAPPVGGHQRAARTGGVARSEWTGILAWATAQAKAANLDDIHARVRERALGKDFEFVPLADGTLVDPETGEVLKPADPTAPGGGGVNGVPLITRDDMRPPDDGRDGKTDSHVAQTIAVHVLHRNYHWAHGLGWMWLPEGSTTWQRIPDEASHDDARRYLLARYREAVDDIQRVGTGLNEAEGDRDRARGDVKTGPPLI